MENKKHAYLLMLHHRKDLVDLLIAELDDARNDLFVHIDPRSKDLDFENLHTNHAGLFRVDPIEVNWGGCSQIRCELLLMKKAKEQGPYAYYHLLQGSSFPLKSQDELHTFYDTHQGTEFIAIDRNLSFRERVSHHYYFNECIAMKTRKQRILWNFSMKIIRLQDKLNIDHFRKFQMSFKKGFALWSITDAFLDYVLKHERIIRKMMRFSHCGDEIFMQTLVYNSPFCCKLNFIDEEFSSSLWYSTWVYEDVGLKRNQHNFLFCDLDDILNSGANFARKFEGEDGIALINAIKDKIHGKK